MVLASKPSVGRLDFVGGCSRSEPKNTVEIRHDFHPKEGALLWGADRLGACPLSVVSYSRSRIGSSVKWPGPWIPTRAACSDQPARPETQMGSRQDGREPRSALLVLILISGPLSARPPDPSVLGVARTRSLHVFVFHLRDLVTLNRIAFGFYINIVDSRGIQTEDLRLDFGSQLLVSVLFSDLVANLEAPKPFDLRLRTAAPDRVSAPDYAILAARQVHHLTQEVHCRLIVSPEPAGQSVPRAPNLEVDILQIVLLDDVYQL